jgi:hypothetical protein
MKKYLMMGAAALAFGFAVVSCSSNDDIYNPDAQSDLIVANYQKAFIHVFGQPAANHTWGFGAPTRATRSGNTGETYPATHEYKDANGNVIAGANMNHNEWGDPNKEYGGWIVPDPLTEGQKLRVKAYFQSKPDISYEDPHFRHFFVQQVYKGGPSTAGTNSTEQVVAADGSKYTSDNMNHLTVGEANSHINDFNAGTCTTSNVLNHEKKTQEDEITLMVNVDDTSCFGYHDTGSSDQSSASPNHNDKMALVAASVIDAWAEANKDALIASGEYGEAVDDTWHRSFMGFDLAIKEGEQAYAKDNDGNVMYADYSQAPTSPAYAWDGEKIIEIKEKETIVHSEWWSETIFTDYKDEYKTIMKNGKYSIGWLTTNKNFYVAADQITLTGEYSNGEIEQSSLNDESLKNVLVFKDVKVPGAQNNKAHVINLKRIMELVDEGYLPVKDKNLTEWVKVGVSDGVFSDWIVTLTEAKRIPVSTQPSLRVMAEDLSAGEDGDDFDFNDVVFDVTRVDETHAKITLQAAGGTLPLRINSTNGVGGWEVHQLFGVANNVMVNTKAKAKGLTGDEKSAVTKDAQGKDLIVEGNFPENKDDFNAAVKGIRVEVQKVVNGEQKWFELEAEVGQAACKIGVPTDLQWADERTNVDSRFNFKKWVQNPSTPLVPAQQQ